MGTHVCETVNRQTSQVGPPESAQNRLKQTVLNVSWSLIGAEGRARQNYGPAQVDAKELPRQSQKALNFLTFVAHSTLGHPFVGRPSFPETVKKQWFYHVLCAQDGPILCPQKEHQKSKNERRAAMQHGSTPAQNETSGTLLARHIL